MNSPNNHPDYLDEKERLEYTKDYIQSILEVAELSQASYQDNIKDAFVNLDYLDSSLSYINILTNARLLEMVQGDRRNLEKVKDKPYFGRVDFTRYGTNHTEKYYIGKVSLYRKDNQEPIIVDWRSPVANIYYEGRLGEVSYQAEDGEHSGSLDLKRQYIIEEGALNEIRDIDITTRDELLQKSLSEKADNRLNDIVATIQEEQNQVIRANLQKPIIVQGVAGSGKTTIALHRLSYFIYNYTDKISPEQLMILAPNKMFINYISESLPELGVERINQTTFVDYVIACLGKKLKIADSDKKLKQLIDPNTENKKTIQWISTFKGSKLFETILKRYLKDIRNHYVPDQELFIGKFRFYSSKKIKKLFIKDYNYLPFNKRKEKINQLLKDNFKKRKKDILEKIEEQFEEKYDRIVYKYKDPETRRKKAAKLIDNKEIRSKEVKNQTNRIVNDYIKLFPKKKATDYYKALLTDEKLLKKYAGEDLTDHDVNSIIQHSTELLSQNMYEVEDLAALLYLQSYIYGIEDNLKMKYIVIDEGQDYSLFQIRALSKATGTQLFTILGDLSQGIHAYRGTNNWKTIIKSALPKANYLTLQKSYRTTIEIMNLANGLLEKLNNKLPTAEPVVRHGETPTFTQTNTKEETCEQLIQKIESYQNQGYSSIAVLGKTEKECKWIYKGLKKRTGVEVQYLKENDEIEKNVIIVPSYLAKGLEFDAVTIVSFDEEFENNETELKLLYVAMTRGMHCLDLIGNNLKGFQLNETDLKVKSLK
ncbi:RNA polymerase recycling motor HelD [Gracilibacillus sp. YIM 98692]|uniref:RNA polymerase recycling motor HelD n=1 Tax=Gracilibacillus sp. YIM 98692 TaxID=2663532 RepID=UPI0013D2E560|nr:RNA polymerase recycling motor HelD [Gracilibacillus sp. YIM 98692]